VAFDLVVTGGAALMKGDALADRQQCGWIQFRSPCSDRSAMLVERQDVEGAVAVGTAGMAEYRHHLGESFGRGHLLPRRQMARVP
jgi:hypothetical protein